MADERPRMTFDGRPFRLAPETVRTLIDRYYPLDHLNEYVTHDADRHPRLQHLGIPPAPVIRPRLNDLYYPTGATRWACFRGLMARTDLAGVLDDCFGAEGASHHSLPLPFIFAANGVKVETNLYMLPPRPVPELGEENADEAAWLVTLVDERYYWQGRSAGSIRPEALSWADLIDALATALGVSIDYDAVDAAYGEPEPDSALYSNYENPAALLEAVSHCIGCVVCRDFDGTIRLERWSDANTLADDAGLGAFSGLGVMGLVRTVGGLILPFDSGVSSPARAGVLPRRVVVTFPKWITDTGYAKPSPNYRSWELASYPEVYAVTVTAVSLGGDYANFATQDIEAVLRTTAKAEFAAAVDVDPTNLTDVQALAEALAADLYDRYTGAADVAYPGVPAEVEPRWGTDFLFVWPLEAGDKPHTRISRPAWNLQPQEFQHGFGPLEADDTVVTNVCPTFSGGVVTSITVEYRRPDGTTICVENPTDCCPVVSTCTVCEGAELPLTLYLTRISGCDATALCGGSVTSMTFSPVDGDHWTGGQDCLGASDCICIDEITMRCEANAYVADITRRKFTGTSPSAALSQTSLPVTVIDCDPFCATFTATADAICLEDTVYRISADPDATCAAPTYDCDGSGRCVLADPGPGTYASLAECLAGCGSGTGSGTACCDVEPDTITLTISGAESCDFPPESPSTFTKTAAGTWEGEFTACALCNATLTCTDGLWEFNPGRCDRYFENVVFVSASCDPLVVVFDATYNCGVGCDVPVTLTFAE